MAIEQVHELTDRTLFAKQYLDRLSPTPSVEAHFVRVEPTGQNSALGLPVYRIHPEPWRYTLRISNPALLVDRQAFALAIIVTEALEEAGVEKTEQEVSALVGALMARGITFDHAQTQAWENLETRRRAGETFALTVEVTEGKKYMEAAGLPTG